MQNGKEIFDLNLVACMAQMSQIGTYYNFFEPYLEPNEFRETFKQTRNLCKRTITQMKIVYKSQIEKDIVQDVGVGLGLWAYALTKSPENMSILNELATKIGDGDISIEQIKELINNLNT